MPYLLDTDTLSNLVRRQPSRLLLARIASVPAAEQYTSTITLGELPYGALRIGAQGDPRFQRIEALVVSNLKVLPFDINAARRYAEVRVVLERQGTPIGDADMQIAGIALANGLTVVTGNVRHFARVPGLQVENWPR